MAVEVAVDFTGHADSGKVLGQGRISHRPQGSMYPNRRYFDSKVPI